MLKIVVPIYANCEEDEDELEVLAQRCRDNGNSHLLQGFHACPVMGLDGHDSLLDCPFYGEKREQCTEISALDWKGILVKA